MCVDFTISTWIHASDELSAVNISLKYLQAVVLSAAGRVNVADKRFYLKRFVIVTFRISYGRRFVNLLNSLQT